MKRRSFLAAFAAIFAAPFAKTENTPTLEDSGPRPPVGYYPDDHAIVFLHDGVPCDGPFGTRAGAAPTGTLCIDKTTGNGFINVATNDSPIWIESVQAIPFGNTLHFLPPMFRKEI